MVRSHFDYAMVIWNPHTVKYIESIEGVQRRATKMVPEITRCTRGDARSFFCTYKTYLYAQN